MRGTTLPDLLLNLKAELNESLNNISTNQRYTRLLMMKQNKFACEYDWDFLKGQRFDVVATPGVDTYDLPTNLNMSRDKLCTVFFNNIFQDVNYGIETEEYNYLNPEQGKSQDPILKWQESGYRQANVAAPQLLQFQIWPLPTTAQPIRFWGSRLPNVLKANTDRCDLDDDLLVLHVAADELARLEQKNAPWMAKRAAERLMTLRGQTNQSDDPITLGGSKNMTREQRRAVPLIVTHG